MKVQLEFDQEEMCLLLTVIQDLAVSAKYRPTAMDLLSEMRGEGYCCRDEDERPPHSTGMKEGTNEDSTHEAQARAAISEAEEGRLKLVREDTAMTNDIDDLIALQNRPTPPMERPGTNAVDL